MDRDGKIKVSIFQEVFLGARNKGGIYYLYAMLRMAGIQNYDIDPIKKEYLILKAADNNPGHINDFPETVNLIANILEISEGAKYKIQPLPNSSDIVGCLYAVTRKKPKSTFAKGLAGILERRRGFLSLSAREFLVKFLDAYFERITLFAEDPNRYTKFREPEFSVFEIITDTTGLRGFNIHYSSGARSSYIRKDTGTMSIYTMFDGIVSTRQAHFIKRLSRNSPIRFNGATPTN